MMMIIMILMMIIMMMMMMMTIIIRYNGVQQINVDVDDSSFGLHAFVNAYCFKNQGQICVGCEDREVQRLRERVMVQGEELKRLQTLLAKCSNASTNSVRGLRVLSIAVLSWWLFLMHDGLPVVAPLSLISTEWVLAVSVWMRLWVVMLMMWQLLPLQQLRHTLDLGDFQWLEWRMSWCQQYSAEVVPLWTLLWTQTWQCKMTFAESLCVGQDLTPRGGRPQLPPAAMA